MPIDDELLILILQTRWSSEAWGKIADFIQRNQVDWDLFLQVIKAERLGGIVYSLTYERRLIPGKYENLLRDEYYKTLHQNLIYMQVLDAGLQAVAGIPLIVLKGAAFITTLYRNPALRPMSDVDVLVRKNDVKKAFQMLLDAGFYPAEPEIDAEITWNFAGEIALRAPGQREVYLELHWHLCNAVDFQRKIQLDDFWKGTQQELFGEREAWIFSPETMIVYLCAHCCLHHGCSGLLFLNDIAEVITQAGEHIQWEEVIRLGCTSRLEYPLQQILPLLAADWAIPIPSEVINRMNSWTISRREIQRYAELALYEHAPVSMNLLHTLRTLPDMHSRVLFAYHHMFPSTNFMKTRYNIKQNWLIPFFYLYRWMRGLRRQVG